MAKQFTVEEIANYIINSDYTRYEDGLYYVHVKENGELVGSYSEADETFTASFDASEWEHDEDPARFYEEAESVDNPDFMRTVENLTEQVNTWLREVNE